MKPDKIYLSLTLLLLLTFFSWFTSCTHVGNIANVPEVCFTGDVLPVFVNNCAISGCHNGSGRESRMNLSNYTDISNEVVPGNPDGSRLYQAIISKWGNLMPPNKPLSISDRTKIRVWIEQGAPYTVCTDTTGTGGGGGGGGRGGAGSGGGGGRGGSGGGMGAGPTTPSAPAVEASKLIWIKKVSLAEQH